MDPARIQKKKVKCMSTSLLALLAEILPLPAASLMPPSRNWRVIEPTSRRDVASLTQKKRLNKSEYRLAKLDSNRAKLILRINCGATQYNIDVMTSMISATAPFPMRLTLTFIRQYGVTNDISFWRMIEPTPSQRPHRAYDVYCLLCMIISSRATWRHVCNFNEARQGVATSEKRETIDPEVNCDNLCKLRYTSSSRGDGGVQAGYPVQSTFGRRFKTSSSLMENENKTAIMHSTLCIVQ